MLNNITLGQYFPGNSLLHRLDPRTKLLCTLLFIVGIFLAQTPLAYGILCAFTLLVIVLGRLPLVLVLKSIKPIWIILVLTLCIHALSYQGGTILYQYSFFAVTQEGLAQGIKMCLRLVLLLFFSSVLTLTTSPIVLTDGIESLLRPFKCVGLPAHELAMMMTIALRFIPTLLEETDRIMKAQTARGADFEEGNMLVRGKNMLPLLIPLFVSSFRRADELAIAMEARCYRGGEGRTRMHQLHYSSRDVLAFVGIFVLLAVLAVLRFR